MHQKNSEGGAAFALAIIAAVVSAECQASAQEVDPAPPAQESPFHPSDRTEGFLHDMVRVLISETGWDDRAEQSALGWTIARRTRTLRARRGWSGRRTLRRIADRALVQPRTRRQHWLHALNLEARRPEGWRTWTTARFDESRAKSVIDFARDLLAGRVADPCDGPTQLWGSRRHPVDAARIRRKVAEGRWRIVSCGLEETSDDNIYIRWTTRAERAESRPQRLPRNLARVRYVD